MCSKEPEIIHESKNADNFFGSYKETITVSTTSPIIKLAFKFKYYNFKSNLQKIE